jgi:hypothetical protein
MARKKLEFKLTHYRTGRIFAQSQIHDKIMAAYKETVVTWRAETLRREIAGLKTELIELRD